MDQATKESLDFQYILNNISTLTPYGAMHKARLKAYLPSEEEKLRIELEKIEKFIPIRREFNNVLSRIKDLRTSIRRAMDRFVLTEVEIFEIKNFLFAIRDLSRIIDRYNVPVFSNTEILPVVELERRLDPEDTGISSFYIYDSYSEKLKKLRGDKRSLDREIRLKKKEIKENIKVDLNLDVRPDGSVVVQKSDKDLIKRLETYENLIYISETYMNVKFSIRPTEEIKTMEREVNSLKEKEEKEELFIRERLSREIANKRRDLFKNISGIGRLDLLIAKTKYAIDINGTKPNIIKEQEIHIVDGIHIKSSDFLKSNGLEFTPISISLKRGVSCITGANMGGKTISLKMVGLLSAMAQYGFFVPAKEMRLSLNNFIKTSIGDMQSTDSGLSTFGRETKTVQEAIEMSNNRGLILIDELARGTNPEEGYAISKAIVKYLRDRNSISLLTTHYDNVANMEGVLHLQVVGLSGVDMDELAYEFTYENKMEIINKYMDYNLRAVDKTTSVPKDAINIAKIMGLEEEILELAESYLSEEIN